MKAVIYLLSATFSILVGAFILRFIMQLVRADFRTPVAQVVMNVTNPLVLPLRKIFPPIKKIDTATLLAAVLASLLMVFVMLFFRGMPLEQLLANPLDLIWMALRNLLSLLLGMYWIIILFSVLLSWIQPNSYSPFTALIQQLTEPVFRPIRRIIPPMGGLDITPIPVLLILGALQQQFGFML